MQDESSNTLFSRDVYLEVIADFPNDSTQRFWLINVKLTPISLSVWMQNPETTCSQGHPPYDREGAYAYYQWSDLEAFQWRVLKAQEKIMTINFLTSEFKRPITPESDWSSGDEPPECLLKKEDYDYLGMELIRNLAKRQWTWICSTIPFIYLSAPQTHHIYYLDERRSQLNVVSWLPATNICVVGSYADTNNSELTPPATATQYPAMK